MARRDFPGGAVSYYFSDELKTADVITDSAANIKSESDYYPFGGELSFLSNDSNHYKHNGKERDAETGLDYYGARYYSPLFSRFISPDWSSVPVPVPYADSGNPQTLNQYAFVHNNPMSIDDPDGHGDAMTHYNQCQHDPSCRAAMNKPIDVAIAGAVVDFGKRFGQAAVDLASDFYNFVYEGVKGSNQIHEQLCECNNSTNQNQRSESKESNTSKQSSTGNQSGQGTSAQAGTGKETGSYTNTHASGKTYSGKGSRARSQVSGKRVEQQTGDQHTATDWTSSANDREAFKDESSRIDANGGAKSSNNYNQRESPGKNYKKQDGPN
jgi:RHS repeat-associated protein